MSSIKTKAAFLDSFSLNNKKYYFYSFNKLKQLKKIEIANLPYSIKILLEALLRNFDNKIIKLEDIIAVANWTSKKEHTKDIAFMPTRVILQDFTGVPAVVDLAALRSAMERNKKDPSKINPLVPVDLVIDHSIQVDFYGSKDARLKNEKKEFERNTERYKLLKWAQNAFNNFRVVPPGRGIVHQINLEYLAQVVRIKEEEQEKRILMPDTLVGTDSHTTMINSLGVLGWGVGGIEAEAVMLGQPYYMPIPEVIGVRLKGELLANVTATDLVLTITELLRKHGVVGKFVEFFGPGIKNLTLPDRATISNMSPEYGATCGYFPIDEQTLNYLRLSGRSEEQIEIIREYTQKQFLFYDEALEPEYTTILELDLKTVKPSVAGPKRPQDRILIEKLQQHFQQTLKKEFGKETKITELTAGKEFNRWKDEGGCTKLEQLSQRDDDYKKWLEKKVTNVNFNNEKLTHGSIVIAAITSCTNTSNPFLLLGAGLLAKKASQLGLKVNSKVKTSFAPGSRVVTEYMRNSGLLANLEQLGFNIVGYGCTTCIGNSGPLDDDIISEIKNDDLVVGSVLSGNRNFEGRINPYTKVNYLASPILVVAYALAGTVNIDIESEPIGVDKHGKYRFLDEIWPTKEEINSLIQDFVSKELFEKQYSEIFSGTKLWDELEIPKTKSYSWNPNSTYIKEPPFFIDFPKEEPTTSNIINARILALLGDTITTDHISPAGAIPHNDPAGLYLKSKDVDVMNFNSFGSRRGNHEVMIRGTFGNIRLRNKLTPKKEGGWTVYHPTKEEMTIYEAAENYSKEQIPLIIIAGKEYGTGSSRDWAAKGTLLLGVKAVIAESYERIHRSNLVGMGVLPLEFLEKQNASNLEIKGDETFDIIGLDNLSPNQILTIKMKKTDGTISDFKVKSRLDSEVEIDYYQNGGILHTVLRKMLNE